MKKHGRLLFQLTSALILSFVVSACTTQQYLSEAPSINKKNNWVLLPLINYSQTPMAGERAESILETRLYKAGVKNIAFYLPQISDDILPTTNEYLRYNTALKWARLQQPDFVITGSIEEWRYKNGLDGEPAVGISLKILKMPEEKVLWSGSAARAGWSRESLAATAQMVIDDLVSDIRFE